MELLGEPGYPIRWVFIPPVKPIRLHDWVKQGSHWVDMAWWRRKNE